MCRCLVIVANNHKFLKTFLIDQSICLIDYLMINKLIVVCDWDQNRQQSEKKNRYLVSPNTKHHSIKDQYLFTHTHTSFGKHTPELPWFMITRWQSSYHHHQHCHIQSERKRKKRKKMSTSINNTTTTAFYSRSRFPVEITPYKENEEKNLCRISKNIWLIWCIDEIFGWLIINQTNKNVNYWLID